MIGNEKLSLIQELKNNNMQSTMRNGDVKVETDLDWKLAYSIYNYLLGNTDSLPPYSFIEEISKKSNKDAISMGYGVLINKNMRIDIEDMIRPDLARLDIITDNKYIAYIVNQETGTTKDIDIKEYPRFDSKRVNQLMIYIDEYKHNYINNKDENKKLL